MVEIMWHCRETRQIRRKQTSTCSITEKPVYSTSGVHFTLTIDDIWKLFQETNRLFQESKLEAEIRARVAEFKEFFPEYADKRVMGAVAGMVIEENVDRFAMNEGLFVIIQSGDGVQLANDQAFIPRTW